MLSTRGVFSFFLPVVLRITFGLVQTDTFYGFLLGAGLPPRWHLLAFGDFLCPRDSNPGRGDWRRSFAVPAPQREEEERERERRSADVKVRDLDLQMRR